MTAPDLESNASSEAATLEVHKMKCLGYPYTNDDWNVDNVLDIMGHDWSRAKAEMAALAIGSGMFPYLLTALPSSFGSLVIIDQHPSIHEEMSRRLEVIQHASNLYEYKEEMVAGTLKTELGVVMAGEHSLVRELSSLSRIAPVLGLHVPQGFQALASRIADTELVSVKGSIPEVELEVVQVLDDTPIGFANVTNVANYLLQTSTREPKTYQSGQTVVRKFLQATGTLDFALIASSSCNGYMDISLDSFGDYLIVARN